MSTRMLIDARHQEETRVAVVKGSRVEEFDYESAAKRQLKGNIYLARVTRVEPSLQAAFVEYGGNRHGFLAFSEIHPDYYQIPKEDREELLAAEKAADLSDTEAELEGKAPKADAKADKKAKKEDKSDKSDKKSDKSDKSDKSGKSDSKSDGSSDGKSDDKNTEAKEDDTPDAEKDEAIAAAEKRRNARTMHRRYSIQEVIKRRQVLLVQVVKEERGNKGAALTTYLSLAGRYCVLMPNSTHSGGISRKISNVTDRKRLKTIMSSLKLPENTGCIIRTAGLQRTKTDIKRDLDYLLRLWNGIRELTLKSMAPSLIYAEADLIKRSIRDLYNRDIDEILVEGDVGFKRAKDFMAMLMPNHAKKVVNYKNRIPLLQRYQVETQLESMYNPEVQLKSGGYIVINPTEALISIDVNSGRATKEKSIEATAVKTNLEASEEIARQLRLRDMAGLVVIDFIDMEDRNNNRSVERRMKEVLKNDRARIQVGRISSFGLMEMSRQRLRPNLLEASMKTCGHCRGSGVVRSVESAALHVLRELEEEGVRNRAQLLSVSMNEEVAIYVLNKKRASLTDLEKRYGIMIDIIARRDLGPSDMEVERENLAVEVVQNNDALLMADDYIVEGDDIEAEEGDDEPILAARPSDSESDDDADNKPKRRRRRRGGRRNKRDDNAENAGGENKTVTDGEASDKALDANSGDDKAADGTDGDGTSDEDKPKRARRRRGRRGGRRRRGGKDNDSGENTEASENAETPKDSNAKDDKPADKGAEDVKADTKADTEDKPKPRRRRNAKKAHADADTKADVKAPKPDTEPAKDDKAGDEAAEKADGKAKPKPRRRTTKKADADTADKPADDKSEKPADAEKKPRTRTTGKVAPKKAPAKKAADKAPDAKVDAKADEKPAKKPAAKKTDTVKAEAVKPTSTKAAPKKAAPKAAPKAAADAAPEGDSDDDGPKRNGWWNRTFG